jgi:uncharacterized membrane protein (DUF106 family)
MEFNAQMVTWNYATLMVLVPFGFAAETWGNSELITITTALVLTLPMTVSIFIYSENTIDSDRTKMKNIIRGFEDRISELEKQNNDKH